MKEAFSPFVFKNKDSKQFFIVTSRGCPFKCNFCAEPTFHGNGMRYASTQKVYEHVKKLVDEYGLTILTIYDDQILMNKKRAKELFTLLSKLNIRIEMPNGVTLSYIDEEMAKILKSAGVDTLFLAIESGSKRVLKEIIKKPISFSKISPTVKTLQQNGIFTTGFFVWGLPGEKKEDRELTKKLITDSGLDWAFFSYASPLRGSELYKESIKNNWIPEKYKKLGAIDMTHYILDAGIDKDELEEDMLIANLELNFAANKRFRVKDYDTSIRSFLEVINRHHDQPYAHLCLARSFFINMEK
jgi:anaerobic magnesium-protoporphyrin IX monomethyl ester cyclase